MVPGRMLFFTYFPPLFPSLFPLPPYFPPVSISPIPPTNKKKNIPLTFPHPHPPEISQCKSQEECVFKVPFRRFRFPKRMAFTNSGFLAPPFSVSEVKSATVSSTFFSSGKSWRCLGDGLTFGCWWALVALVLEGKWETNPKPLGLKFSELAEASKDSSPIRFFLVCGQTRPEIVWFLFDAPGSRINRP